MWLDGLREILQTRTVFGSPQREGTRRGGMGGAQGARPVNAVRLLIPLKWVAAGLI